MICFAFDLRSSRRCRIKSRNLLAEPTLLLITRLADIRSGQIARKERTKEGSHVLISDFDLLRSQQTDVRARQTVLT
jgi:hypothetical protein